MHSLCPAHSLEKSKLLQYIGAALTYVNSHSPESANNRFMSEKH